MSAHIQLIKKIHALRTTVSAVRAGENFGARKRIGERHGVRSRASNDTAMIILLLVAIVRSARIVLSPRIGRSRALSCGQLPHGCPHTAHGHVAWLGELVNDA